MRIIGERGNGVSLLRLDCGCEQWVQVLMDGSFVLRHRPKSCGRDGKCSNGEAAVFTCITKFLGEHHKVWGIGAQFGALVQP